MKKKEKIYNFTVVFESIKKGYDIIFPSIPEICTFGETLTEAREIAKDALQCYLESCLKERKPLPQEKITIEKVAVAI